MRQTLGNSTKNSFKNDLKMTNGNLLESKCYSMTNMAD